MAKPKAVRQRATARMCTSVDPFPSPILLAKAQRNQTNKSQRERVCVCVWREFIETTESSYKVGSGGNRE